MKIFILVNLFAALFANQRVFAEANSVLKISVEGLKSDTGGVELSLFNKVNEAHFPIHPDHAVSKEYKSLNGNNKVEFTFKDLPEGEYAAFAYHDEDGNKKINTNFMHIPTEGYGATNGAKNRFGPPKYSDAKFSFSLGGAHEYSVPLKIEY